MAEQKEIECDVTFLVFHLDEIGVVDGLIDSGSNVCAIKRNLLSESQKSRIVPADKTVAVLLDGTKMEILGHVNLNIVDHLGKSMEMQFCVVDDLFVPCILGANWIRKSRAVLQCNSESLTVYYGGVAEEPGCGIECPQPRVSVIVDGIGLLVGMVDTGCKKSKVRKNLLTGHLVKALSPNGHKTIIANGRIIEMQESVSLKVEFERGISICLESVDVLDNMDYQIIFGMDWINASRVIIHSNGREMLASPPSQQVFFTRNDMPFSLIKSIESPFVDLLFGYNDAEFLKRLSKDQGVDIKYWNKKFVITGEKLCCEESMKAIEAVVVKFQRDRRAAAAPSWN